jgi:hypothetical protein
MDNEYTAATSVNVNGALTVSVILKDSLRRRYRPDIKSELAIHFGGKIADGEFVRLLDDQLALLKRNILFASG